MKDKLLQQKNKKEGNKADNTDEQGDKTNINNKYMNEDEEDNTLSLDKSLHCIRVELNRHNTVFLYYKIYPKNNSEKFPQERSAIFFYFDNQNVDEKFFHFYISCAGEIENVEFGNYINRKGSSSKRRIINFALVKFYEKESIENLLNRLDMQLKINAIIERSKNRSVDFSYNPLENIDEQGEDIEEDGPDADGFVEVKANRSNRFSKNGLSFRVMKEKNNVKYSDNDEDGYDRNAEQDDEEGFGEHNEDNDYNNKNDNSNNVENDENEEDEDYIKKKSSKKKKVSDFYYNYQIRDKKKQMYDQLKSLFEQDKKIIKENVNFKKRRVEEDDM